MTIAKRPSCERETAALMDLIWANREAIYFFGEGWTHSISLMRFEKFAVWRKEIGTDRRTASLNFGITARHCVRSRRHREMQPLAVGHRGRLAGDLWRSDAARRAAIEKRLFQPDIWRRTGWFPIRA